MNIAIPIADKSDERKMVAARIQTKAHDAVRPYQRDEKTKDQPTVTHKLSDSLKSRAYQFW